MTQSTISNDVGAAAAKSNFHKGYITISQLINYRSFLEELLRLKNSKSLCMGDLGGPLWIHGGPPENHQCSNHSSKSLPYKLHISSIEVPNHCEWGALEAVTFELIMQFWCPLRFGINRKFVAWFILWFKVKFVMFAEIFVPQDFTIRTTHGFKGPANTCDGVDTLIPDPPRANFSNFQSPNLLHPSPRPLNHHQIWPNNLIKFIFWIDYRGYFFAHSSAK